MDRLRSEKAPLFNLSAPAFIFTVIFCSANVKALPAFCIFAAASDYCPCKPLITSLFSRSGHSVASYNNAARRV